MSTTRKNIDFPDNLVEQMDQMKDERRVTYNEIVTAAVKEYFAPKPVAAPVDVVDRLDGTRQALEQIQQRLWNLDSSNQKTAERLTALEAIAQQSMELLMLIAERMTEDTAETIDPTPEPVIPAHMPEPVDHGRITDVTGDPRSRWYVPPEPPAEKRSWFRRSHS